MRWLCCHSDADRLQRYVVPLHRDVVRGGCNVLGCGRAAPVGVRGRRVPGAAGGTKDDSGHEPNAPARNTQHGDLLGPAQRLRRQWIVICPVVSVSLARSYLPFPGATSPATPSNTPKTVSCNVATPGPPGVTVTRNGILRKIDCTPGPNAFSTFTVAVPRKLRPSSAPLVTGPCTAMRCSPRKFALPAMRHVKCPCADPSAAITAVKPKCDPSMSPSPSRSAPKVVVPPPVTWIACANGAAARSLEMAAGGAKASPGAAHAASPSAAATTAV